MEKDIKDYLKKIAKRAEADLKEAEADLKDLEAKNNTCDNEKELKAIGEDAEALKAKIEDLKAQLKEAEDQLAEIDQPAEDPQLMEGDDKERALKTMNREERKTMNLQEREARAKKFAQTERMTIPQAEARAMLVSSGKIATPTKVSGINELNNEVSSIVDLIYIEDCEGMGSDKVAYEFTAPTAGVTSEGDAYQAGDTVVDYVTLQPDTITTISDISKQVRKQTALNYEDKVRKNALNALRKKMSNKAITNIYASTLNTTINATVANGVGVIDETTLRKIALNYGGDENVVGNAVLFLNKLDLVAFGDVRGSSDKKPVYEITPDTTNPNMGIIKDGGLSVKYCINSNCNVASGATQTTSAIKTMLYGQPVKCKCDLFSDYDVAVSEDFKFDKGLLTIRGDVEADIKVVFKDGFVVYTVPATE